MGVKSVPNRSRRRSLIVCANERTKIETNGRTETTRFVVVVDDFDDCHFVRKRKFVSET